MVNTAIAIFFAACALTAVLTIVLRGAALRFGLTDRPDGHRKLHDRPTPVGGGVAIFVSTLAIVAGLLLVPTPLRSEVWTALPALLPLFLASLAIVATGVVDDIRRMHGKQKLACQCLAVGVLLASGLIVERLSIFGWQLELGLLAIPFTLFWLLGAINSLNLLDGIDGLATMVGIILVSTIGVMAVMIGRYDVGVLALIFAGSLAGFMRFNFPPASIFLGDSGSMLIGLMVGVLAIQGSLKGPGTVLLAAPVAIWAIPILDSAAAVVRRKLTGRSIYAVDRGHLHHRLMDLLGSNRKVLALLAVCCLATSAAALLSIFWKSDLIACLAFLAVIVVFLVTGVFGRVEFLLLRNRIGRVGRSLLPLVRGPHRAVCQTTVRLQGSRQWELLWEAFLESADKLHLVEIHMNVNLPYAKEGYHASWERPRGREPDRCWRMEFPLIVGGRAVGHVAIVGEARHESVCGEIQRAVDLVEPFERQLLALSRAGAPQPVARVEQPALPAAPLVGVPARPQRSATS